MRLVRRMTEIGAVQRIGKAYLDDIDTLVRMEIEAERRVRASLEDQGVRDVTIQSELDLRGDLLIVGIGQLMEEV